MAKYNTPYKYVLEGIQDAVDMGYLSEDRSDWWLQCSWHINGEDIICFFEVLQMLKINVFSRMAAIPVVIEYTEGEEEANIEELGFEGGYKISAESFPSIYIGWCAGTGAYAKELTLVTKLAVKDSVTTFTESKKRNLKESQTEFKKYFEKGIKNRLAKLFKEFVHEDDAQGLVDDFDIDPSNAVKGLFDEIVANEYDELHEGRYDDEFYDEDEGIGHRAFERIGNKVLDKLSKWSYDQICELVGKEYCDKLEKQMQDLGNEHSEDEDYVEDPSDYEKYWKIEPEAIERFRERARELEQKIVYNVHWRYMPYKESEKDDMYFEINRNFLEINCDGTGKIYKVNYYTGETKTFTTLEGIITAKDIDDAFDKYSQIINVEKYFRN